MFLDSDNGSLRIRVFNAIENAILDGEYKEVFKDITMSGELTITLAPGEYMVLTK